MSNSTARDIAEMIFNEAQSGSAVWDELNGPAAVMREHRIGDKYEIIFPAGDDDSTDSVTVTVESSPRERTDPVTGPDGSEQHPAFGMISVHRIRATPGEVLFQSDIRHPEFIRVEVHEAARKRDLKHDWVHPGRKICEVSMSMAQFASFVASTGTTGVPCTIGYTDGSGQRPDLTLAPRLAVTTDEVRAAAGVAYGKIIAALVRYEEGLEAKAGAARCRKLLSDLRAAVKNAAPNVAYAAKALDEHAEAVVEKSRADIEAMVTRMAERAGVPVPDEALALEEGGK